jgi:hypothetical protein
MEQHWRHIRAQQAGDRHYGVAHRPSDCEVLAFSDGDLVKELMTELKVHHLDRSDAEMASNLMVVNWWTQLLFVPIAP